MNKRYEILKGLPGTGPMYITISDDNSWESEYSEGFVVQFFKKDGTDWIANFNTGFTNLSAVYDLALSANLLVVAKGKCYIMNPDSAKALNVFGGGYESVHKTVNHQFVFHDRSAITVVEPDGNYWHSNDVALDGIKEINIENHIVSGLAYNPASVEGEWIPFKYDLITKVLTYEKKSWWKIW